MGGDLSLLCVGVIVLVGSSIVNIGEMRG